MKRQRRERGFTLMELMIVVAIVFVIVGIAIPNYKNARMLTNELAALRMTGTITTVQTQYESQFGRYAVTLAELGPPPGDASGPAGANLLPAALVGGKRAGYLFQMQAGTGGYTVNAGPEFFNSTGRRTFYSDQSMIIRENWGPEPATAASREAGH